MKKFLSLILIGILLPICASAKTDIFNLKVPYTSEIPNGKWVKPWNNACEEAAIVMIAQYYAGNYSARLTATNAINLMLPIFDFENKLWNSNANTDATRTAKIVNDFSSFGAYIKDNPTIEDIKNEIGAGRPVISFHYGYDLKNPNIPWRRGGSYYHVMVITGYDDINQEFIVDDPGNDKSGLDYHYKYTTIMSSLHDYNYKNNKYAIKKISCNELLNDS